MCTGGKADGHGAKHSPPTNAEAMNTSDMEKWRLNKEVYNTNATPSIPAPEMKKPFRMHPFMFG
jgi:hypothetical protein